MQPKKYGTVHFDSQPHGAHVYVDGQLLIDPNTEEPLRTPTSALLVEGRRDYTLTLEGHEDISGYVDVLPGVTVNIFRNLKPGAPEGGWGKPQPQIWLSRSLSQRGEIMNIGNVTITTNPSGAMIYVDSILIKDEGGNVVTTPVTLELNPGYRYITISKEGYEKDYNRVYVHEGADIKLERNLFPLPYHMSEIPQYTPETPEIPYYKPMQSMQGPTTGNIIITTYPDGATVMMDGNTIIDTETKEPLKTPVQLEASMGLHDFIFKLQGYCDGFDSIYVMPGSTQYMHKTFYMC